MIAKEIKVTSRNQSLSLNDTGRLGIYYNSKSLDHFQLALRHLIRGATGRRPASPSFVKLLRSFGFQAEETLINY